MLRKFLVWFSCLVVDYIVLYYYPDTESGKVFFEIHLIATIVMYCCEKFACKIDQYMIEDYYEYQERLDQVNEAFWNVIFVVVIFAISDIITRINADLNRYLVYELITFGFCMNIPRGEQEEMWYSEEEIEEEDAENENKEDE